MLPVKYPGNVSKLKHVRALLFFSILFFIVKINKTKQNKQTKRLLMSYQAKGLKEEVQKVKGICPRDQVYFQELLIAQHTILLHKHYDLTKSRETPVQAVRMEHQSYHQAMLKLFQSVLLNQVTCTFYMTFIFSYVPHT